MDIETFRATAKPISDEVWAAVVENYTVETFRATAEPISVEAVATVMENYATVATRESHVEYAGQTVLFERDGKWWPYAWWYAPVAHDTRASAEEDLNKWYNEFE